MTTFIIGLVILIGGGLAYGKGIVPLVWPSS